VPSGAGDPYAIPSNGSLQAYTDAGVAVNADTAMQLGVVYACVRIISNAVAGLPLDSVRMRGAYREQLDPAPPIVFDPFGGANKLNGITRRDGIARIMVSLLLRGNAYCVVTARDWRQMPTRLRILHPDAVSVKVGDDGEREYRVSRQIVPAVDMLHIVGLSMPGAPTGMSVIDNIRSSVALGIAAEKYGAKFFGNGAHLSGVVQVPGDLDVAKARQLKENFEATHSGMGNAHMVGVLTGGAVFEPISVTPENAQFLGTRQAQTLDIAMEFGVPPHMLGQVDRTTSWGKGIEEQKLGFLNFTLADWTGRIEDAWSAMLPGNQVARFNLDAFLRADTSTRYGTYAKARTVSLLTINEIRALENLPPVPGGDEIMAPLNSAHTINTVTDDNDDDLGDNGEDPQTPVPDGSK
jgi:HK97 family phage portal protein